MSDIAAVIRQARTHLHPLAADTETDPTLRQFARYDVPEGAQLRQLYAELVQAQAEYNRMMAIEATIKDELQHAAARAAALTPHPPRPNTPLPTFDDARELLALRQLAGMLNDRLALVIEWQKDYRRVADVAQRNFDNVWRGWADLRYTLDGSQDLAPQMTIGEWKAPDATTRANILAALQRFER